jgi:hypothetical protein
MSDARGRKQMTMMGEGKFWAMNVVTVRELIAELQKYPPRALVMAETSEMKLGGDFTGELLTEVEACECVEINHGWEVGWIETGLSKQPENTNIVLLKFQRVKASVRLYVPFLNRDPVFRPYTIEGRDDEEPPK